MPNINYENIISELKSELNCECAIANRYGIVLASLINEINKNKIIPQKILELINSRTAIGEELKLSEINSFALAAEKNNYLFTFSEELILISKLDFSVNLAKFMPVISAFLTKLSQGSRQSDLVDFSTFDFGKEINKIEQGLIEEKPIKEKFSIIKDLVKFISS